MNTATETVNTLQGQTTYDPLLDNYRSSQISARVVKENYYDRYAAIWGFALRRAGTTACFQAPYWTNAGKSIVVHKTGLWSSFLFYRLSDLL